MIYKYLLRIIAGSSSQFEFFAEGYGNITKYSIIYRDKQSTSLSLKTMSNCTHITSYRCHLCILKN